MREWAECSENSGLVGTGSGMMIFDRNVFFPAGAQIKHRPPNLLCNELAGSAHPLAANVEKLQQKILGFWCSWDSAMKVKKIQQRTLRFSALLGLKVE